MPSSVRSGRYITQNKGFKAFIPSALPPRPGIAMTNRMVGLISEADRALGRLDGSIQTLPAEDMFVLMYVRKEAVLSSQIEGTQSSLDDLLEAEAKILKPGRPRDVREVINYVDAMNHGLSRLAELPVSVRLVREIHKKLLHGTRGSERMPGELRRSQNWIGPRGCTIEEATFVPPPPQDVPSALSDLERFIHAEDGMATLIKIGLVHAQFETIHPFLDGNGRVGRLLITFLLCEGSALQRPVLYISHFFMRHRPRYYELLQAVRDEGDWEGWLEFFLEAVAEVSAEATATAREIVSLRERHRRLITDHFGRVTANGLKVLEDLYFRPLISIRDISDLTKVSAVAASQLMARFVEHNILFEITGRRRNRVFRYSDYIRLFS